MKKAEFEQRFTRTHTGRLDKIKPKTGIFKCYDCSAHGDFGEYKCPNCGGEYVRRKEVLK